MVFYDIRLTCVIFQVPVVAIFTKYDQFKRNIKMKLEDEGRDLETHFRTEVESVFNRYYLSGLGGNPPFIRLESEDIFSQLKPNLIYVL